MKCRYNVECKRGCTSSCECVDLYRPSNGTEGMRFMEAFCDQCLHQNPDPDPVHTKAKNCKICLAAMCYSPWESQYPKEWRYVNGQPTCTAWQKWDWGTNGDPDDPDNPNAPPPPPDSNQLELFPLYPNDADFELTFEDTDKKLKKVLG